MGWQYIAAPGPAGRNENRSQKLIKIMRLSCFAAVQVHAIKCAPMHQSGLDYLRPVVPAQNRI
jgi:hypothetical protein